MRIVGGAARGRPLRAPAGRVTRPTSDRVREAMFDILGSVIDLHGITVVDLFAGSGALGLEALSRGAGRATFVESDRTALATLRTNLEALGWAGPPAAVVAGDVARWAAMGRQPVDLVFADPPYTFDDWSPLLASLAVWAELVVLETGRELQLPEGWVLVRQRRYGATVVTVARPAPRSDVPVDAKGGM